MSFVERLTFRGKLTLVILVTSGLALALAAIGIIGHGVLTGRDEVESQLRVAAQHLGSSASAADGGIPRTRGQDARKTAKAAASRTHPSKGGRLRG